MSVLGFSLVLAQTPRFSYRPFLDPIAVDGYWWLLLIPLAFGVSVSYKAVRMKTLERYWRDVAVMTVQIVLAMILLGIASYALIEVYARAMVERAG